MKDIGSAENPLRFVGEELQLDVFDGSDPADTGTRRWWFRPDLSVNDSDAVIRVNNNGQILDVPVFEESTPVEDGIDTSFGVVAPSLSEPAFAPLTDPADAAFDFARLETPAGTELSLHDRLAPGSAIADSAIHRWPFDEGSGTSLTDAIGSADASATGINWVSGDYEGGFAVQTDGVDDNASTTIDINQYSEWMLCWTIDTTQTSRGEIFEWRSGIDAVIGEINAVSANKASFFTIDGSGGDNVVSTTTINDGSKYRLSFGIVEGSEAFIAVNGTIEDTVSVGTLVDVGDTLRWWGDTTNDRRYYDGVSDQPILYTDTSQSTIDGDYSLQPWS